MGEGRRTKGLPFNEDDHRKTVWIGLRLGLDAEAIGNLLEMPRERIDIYIKQIQLGWKPKNLGSGERS